MMPAPDEFVESLRRAREEADAAVDDLAAAAERRRQPDPAASSPQFPSVPSAGAGSDRPRISRARPRKPPKPVGSPAAPGDGPVEVQAPAYRRALTRLLRVPHPDREQVDPEVEVSWQRRLAHAVSVRILSAALSGAAAVATAAALLSAVPSIGHPSQPAAAAVAAVAAILLGFGWYKGFSWRRGTLIPALLAAALVFAGAGIGASRSIIQDGRVLLDSDTRAASVRFHDDLRRDLAVVAGVVPLLATDASSAAARYAEFEPAKKKVTDVVNHLNAATAPDVAFTPAVSVLRSAALLAADALTVKADLVREPDAQREQANVEQVRRLALLLQRDVAPALERAGLLSGALQPKGAAT